MILLSTKVKNAIPKFYDVKLRNISINGQKRGCSGFVKFGSATVYINTESIISGRYLYRKAQNSTDYTGGINRYAKSLNDLVSGVEKILLNYKLMD